MNPIITTGTAAICLLASLVTTQTHAGGFSMGNSQPHGQDTYTTNRPWGNLTATTPAPQYQPPLPPLPAGYYPGAAPGTGWYSAQLPAAGPTENTAPVVEVEVSDTVFYEQQNTIYTVRVVSDGNLAVLNRNTPRIEGAALELIDGPLTTTRANGHNHSQQIVNTYRYKLKPLQSGDVVVPSIEFTGTHTANRQQNLPASKFTIATAARTLLVRPADPSVQPWLPLHELRLQTSLQQDAPVKAGQPVTLTVELTAQGAQGSQLPSLADQIKSPLFRVYRDATATTSGISANGRHLTGSRKETYTLIPLEDGWIHLPNINVAWWDVARQQAMLAGLPSTEAYAGSKTTPATTGAESRSPLFWAPMAIALALIAGYLLGAWQRTRALFRQAATWLSASGRHVAMRSRQIGNRLSPARQMRRARMSVALLMPKAMKIWLCTRCLATEDNPQAWCTEFKSRVCETLGIPGHSTLSIIAEKIIATSPRTEPARLRELAHTLDGAIYGGQALDFIAWKRELQQQLRPHLLRRSRNRLRRSANRLPALNPRTA